MGLGIELQRLLFQTLTRLRAPHAPCPPQKERRLTGLHRDIEELLFSPDCSGAVGQLEDRNKPILFSMARLDKVRMHALDRVCVVG